MKFKNIVENWKKEGWESEDYKRYFSIGYKEGLRDGYSRALNYPDALDAKSKELWKERFKQ